MKTQGYANYYIGLVVAVTKDDDDRLENDKEWHEILVDVPGIIQGVHAFPFRDELDEPKINDKVLILDVDPLYHSYFLYRKVKEDGFIGFRSSGKMVSITPDDITIGIFKPDADYKEDEVPDCNPKDDGSGDGFAYVKLTKDGDIDIKTKGFCKINIAGKESDDSKKGCIVTINESSEVNIKGESTVNINGESKINVDENVTVTSKKTATINGGNSQAKTESVVFGDELKSQLSALSDRVDSIVDNIGTMLQSAGVAPMDGGTTMKASMIGFWSGMKTLMKQKKKGGPNGEMWDSILNNDVKTGGTIKS